MKNLLIILLCLPVFMFGQEEAAPANLYEVVDIKVKAGQEDAFEAAVKAHNESFHGDGMHSARLFYNINGPSGGTYTWVMGPTNYASMDTRPKDDAHNDDWAKVSEFVDDFSSPSYWSYDDKLSQYNEEADDSKRLIWVYDIKLGQGHRWSELVGKIKEVYTEKKADESMIVVWNNFANTKAGKDAAVIFPFGDWSWMDKKSNFAKDYEEVHGPGSWHHFLNEFSQTTNGRVDWLRVLVD